jgi:hypothetical protein
MTAAILRRTGSQTAGKRSTVQPCLRVSGSEFALGYALSAIIGIPLVYHDKLVPTSRFRLPFAVNFRASILLPSLFFTQ